VLHNEAIKYIPTYIYFIGTDIKSDITHKKGKQDVWFLRKSRFYLHSVYLVTYSKADTKNVETRQPFSHIVIEVFGESLVKQWVCICEKHKEEGLQMEIFSVSCTSSKPKWNKIMWLLLCKAYFKMNSFQTNNFCYLLLNRSSVHRHPI